MGIAAHPKVGAKIMRQALRPVLRQAASSSAVALLLVAGPIAPSFDTHYGYGGVETPHRGPRGGGARPRGRPRRGAGAGGGGRGRARPGGGAGAGGAAAGRG